MRLSRAMTFTPLTDEDIDQNLDTPSKERSNRPKSAKTMAKLEGQVTIPQKEMEIYSKTMTPREVEAFKSILERKSINVISKSEINTMLQLILKLDLTTLPQKHVVLLSRWAGTSTLRKFDNRASKELLLACYQELKRRGFLDSILVIREEGLNERAFNSERLESCESLLASDGQLQAKVVSAYEKAKANVDSFTEVMNVLVELSNTNIYIHELFQSAKLLLGYAATRTTIDEAFAEQISLRVPNYVWGMMKLSYKDAEFYERVVRSFADKKTDWSESKEINIIYMLTLNYYLTDPASRTKEQTDYLKGKMESILKTLNESPSFAINSKFAYICCQIALCLFPEIGPVLKADTLADLKPQFGNPFESIFYSLKHYFVISYWVVLQNRESKSGSFKEQVSYTKHPGSFILVWKPSMFNHYRVFEDNLFSAFLSFAPKVKLSHGKMVGFYEVDFMVGDSKVIEAYSKSHFVHNSDKPILASAIKERHLQAMGIDKIVYVNQDDFKKAGPAGIPAYINSLIAKLE